MSGGGSSLAPKNFGAKEAAHAKRMEGIKKQLGSSSTALKKSKASCDEVERQVKDSLALEQRCRSHLQNASRAAASVKMELTSGEKMGREAAEDLTAILTEARHVVSVHERAHEALGGVDASVSAEKLAAMAADLREAMAHARKVLSAAGREGEAAKRQLSAATIALSQAIAADNRGQVGKRGGGGMGGGTPTSGPMFRRPSPRPGGGGPTSPHSA